MSASAHPRSRGENGVAGDGHGQESGSSPLTRGKLPGGGPGSRARRLIPAHAGKTAPGLGAPPPWPAHPRSRGENTGLGGEVAEVGGSSPLTRGKPVTCTDARSSTRLIPAHAGKTRPPQDEDDCYTGSSPLTRGKRGLGTPGRRHRRLIPAHAGKTCLRGSAVGPRPAHPRSRGENRDMGGTVPPRPGSSPLTRGKPPDGSRATANRRLIPAHAGKTAAPPPPISTRTAHPRSRGENAIPCISSCTICGSSPLTRGKRHFHGLSHLALRLIPAHAGKTRGAF